MVTEGRPPHQKREPHPFSRHGIRAPRFITIAPCSRRLGWLVASDSGVWLERDPDTVREPDIAFTSAERLPLDVRLTGYAEVVPDLVVEIVSPSDSRREVHDKAQMWLRHGVRLVWVVHPDTRTVDVHQQDGSVATLGDDSSLDGLDVLPGFSCAVSAVFDT